MNRYLTAALVAATLVVPSTASASPRPYERDHVTVQKVMKITKHVRQIKPDTTRTFKSARPYARG